MAAFVLVGMGEILAPSRSLSTSKTSRWINNLILTFINPLIVRLIFPVLAIGMALKAQERGWGLLNNIDLPLWLKIGAGIIMLDLAIYLQHVMFHSLPVLWRLHMVHHTDLDYDMTTGLRFHPLEIVLSMGIKLAAIMVVGPSATAVLAFEVILNVAAMFNHGNIKLPPIVDYMLRFFIVTPDMHRIHHSVIRFETDSNYGFNVSWWDRLFGTYCRQPIKGHTGMTIGLSEYRDPKKLNLLWLLILPFVKGLSRNGKRKKGTLDV